MPRVWRVVANLLRESGREKKTFSRTVTYSRALQIIIEWERYGLKPWIVEDKEAVEGVKAQRPRKQKSKLPPREQLGFGW